MPALPTPSLEDIVIAVYSAIDDALANAGITSRNGKRWVIPKGWIDPGQTAGETALQEAWEEAGLTGALERPSTRGPKNGVHFTTSSVLCSLSKVCEMHR